MEYEDFLQSNSLALHRDQFQASLKTWTLDYGKTDLQKYERLAEAFGQFMQEARAKVRVC
jgi:hypothetical protein